MKTLERVIITEDNGEVRACVAGSICKKDILDMLEKEIKVCRQYNIMSLRLGLEAAYTTVVALPMNYRSVVIKPMVMKMIEDQIHLAKSYALHDNIKGLEHAKGMIRVLEGDVA